MSARFADVTLRFPGAATPALDGVSGEVAAGRITGLVGPDAAGKTTLVRVLDGLLKADSGTLDVCGFDPATASHHLHDVVGYMPQRFGLYEDLTVSENLRLHADLKGLPAAGRPATFDRLLGFTDLARFAKRRAGALSGGMKQKLGLACALLGSPRLLLLDEPSVGVDPASRRELWRMVRALVDDGLAVLWSTAYLDEAELCDSVTLLESGRVLFAGPPEAATREVAGRSLKVVGIEGDRRAVLDRALRRPEVIDGVVQGDSLRLVLAEGAPAPDAAALGAGPAARVERVAPRFEDAFMARLGGVRKAALPALPEAAAAGSEDGPPSVEARDLGKRFGDFVAADRVSFTIRPGEVFGLLGPNGAGKSTTFRMMCGLLMPSSGTARVAGHDLMAAPSEARRRIGYMAQKFSLYGDLTVRRNLDFFAEVYGLSGRRKRDARAEMIDTFELAPYLDRKARDLPLGYKQRLALSCAAMHRPPVLFLDEPTSGVDPQTRREFWAHINARVAAGVTVMVTTHFMEEAEYCDRILLMHRGRAVATGTPDALKDRARAAGRPDPTLEDAFLDLIAAETAAAA